MLIGNEKPQGIPYGFHVPEVGVEPTRDFSRMILSHLRLPLRHSGANISVLSR